MRLVVLLFVLAFYASAFRRQNDDETDKKDSSEQSQWFHNSIDQELRQKRSAADPVQKWPNGVVHYDLHPDIQSNPTKVASIAAAMKYISDRTCVKFERGTNGGAFIGVLNGRGCMSGIGASGYLDALSLADGCEPVGLTMHEFIHAIGFDHTHSRADRDNFITVNYTNIPSDLAYILYKVSPDFVNYVPYEYGSLMHYGAHYLSPTGLNTLLPKDDRYLYTMGAARPSFLDMKMINMHYDCPAKCATGSSASCSNDGYPNPNNCQECICPNGYGGKFCDQRPSGCGETLSATVSWQDKTFTIGGNNNELEYSDCNYWVQAPAGGTIQVRVTSMDHVGCNYGCQDSAIEFKLEKPEMTNPRYCCYKHTNVVHNSTLNPMPIIAYNKYHTSTFTIQYKYVAGAVVQQPKPITTTKRAGNTTKQPQTTIKAASNCVDNSPDCAAKKLSGYCDPVQTSFRERKFNCAKTCGLCGQSDTPCRDYQSKYSCRNYVAMGSCKADWAYKSEYQCAKSCGFCKNPI